MGCESPPSAIKRTGMRISFFQRLIVIFTRKSTLINLQPISVPVIEAKTLLTHEAGAIQ